MEYLTIANSPWMWFACGLGVMLTLYQSLVFAIKSLKVRKQVGISDEQLKSAIKTSISSSIGPSIVILVGMVSLLVAMGGPVSWLRLSYIGSVAYELMAAGFGAEAMGVSLGSADMTAEAFAAGLWVMTLGSLGWILFTGLFTDKMDKFRNVLAGGKKALLPVVSAGAMCGAFAYLSLDRIFRFDVQTYAAIGGFVVMVLLLIYNKKAKKKWVKEWAFSIAMFAGMFIAIPFIK